MLETKEIVVNHSTEQIRQQQPLSEEEKVFVESVYHLFESFREGNREQRNNIESAREVRKLRDSKLDIGNNNPLRKSPQLNTLNSTIDNMIADYMDNLPEAVMQPETPELAKKADDLTDVVSWTLYRANFKKEWHRAVEDATVTGTGVLHTYWDEEINLGIEKGGVGIKAWRPEYIFPDPLYDEMQDGRAVFKVCMHPLSYFEQHYPDKYKYINPDAHSILPSEELSRRDTNTHNDPMVALLEVWFRRYDAENNKYSVHMAQVAGGALLYDSRESNPDGVYEHGRYPFTFLRFRELEDSAYGTGMVYEFAETQRMINRFSRYQDENARSSARQRMIVNRNAGVDMSAATDMERTVVEADMTDERAISWIQARPLNSQVMTMMQWLQDTQKQDSGQNQFSRGEGGMGVTAASAIQMLQEAGGKITRLHTSGYMDSFREVVEQLIALTAQYVDKDRIIMITGRDEFNGYGNPRPITINGQSLKDDVLKRPAITVRVNIQRSNPQQISTYNQLLLQMAEISAQAGTPIPAVALMRSMRIQGKEEIIKVLEEADTTRQQMQQLQEAVQQLQAQNQQMQQALQDSGNKIKAQNQTISMMADRMRGSVQPMQSQPQQQPATVNYSGIENALGNSASTAQ